MKTQVKWTREWDEKTMCLHRADAVRIADSHDQVSTGDKLIHCFNSSVSYIIRKYRIVFGELGMVVSSDWMHEENRARCGSAVCSRVSACRSGVWMSLHSISRTNDERGEVAFSHDDRVLLNASVVVNCVFCFLLLCHRKARKLMGFCRLGCGQNGRG